MLEIRKEYKGSFTIEAACIVPLISIILLFLVQLTLFLHNECSAWQSAYLGALRQERSKEENETERLMKESAYGMSFATYEDNVEGKKVISKIKGGVNRKWYFEVESKVYHLKPVSFIRLCKKGDEIFDL